MRVVLNGEAHEVRAEATVAEVVSIAGVGHDGRGVAVAVEGDVVPRAEWDDRVLADGESVEVVHAVQGG